MNPILIRFVEATVLPKAFGWLTGKIFGGSKAGDTISEVATEATQYEIQKATAPKKPKKAEPVTGYDASAEQALANKSPRIGNKTLPAGDPTIEITNCTFGSGSVYFQSKTCAGGKVPEGHEYLFVITNGSKTDNAAASHGVRDRRLWEKVPNPTSFIITLVKDKRNTIVEYSKIINKG